MAIKRYEKNYDCILDLDKKGEMCYWKDVKKYVEKREEKAFNAGADPENRCLHYAQWKKRQKDGK